MGSTSLWREATRIDLQNASAGNGKVTVGDLQLALANFAEDVEIVYEEGDLAEISFLTLYRRQSDGAEQVRMT